MRFEDLRRGTQDPRRRGTGGIYQGVSGKISVYIPSTRFKEREDINLYTRREKISRFGFVKVFPNIEYQGFHRKKRIWDTFAILKHPTRSAPKCVISFWLLCLDWNCTLPWPFVCHFLFWSQSERIACCLVTSSTKTTCHFFSTVQFFSQEISCWGSSSKRHINVFPASHERGLRVEMWGLLIIRSRLQWYTYHQDHNT